MMITARLSDFEFYDPMTDTERVRMMMITSVGTWFTDVEINAGSKMRAARKEFQDAVLEAMAEQELPGEIWLKQ